MQGADKRYAAGPVLSLGATSHSRTALLRAVAMPHLEALVFPAHLSSGGQLLFAARTGG